MTIEEKAKAYDEALERANHLYEEAKRHHWQEAKDYITIFPELAESEDEKNIKDLIDELKCSLRAANCQNDACGGGHEKRIALLEWAIAWLEKQSEQKLVYKIEPMFKVEDWIVKENIVYHIDKISGVYLTLSTLDGTALVYHKSVLYNDKIHLWTIQDAKDGDVLICESGWTCIFKTLVNDETFSSYCFMDDTKWFCETGSECHTLKEEFVKAYNGKIHPATKEQRDQLEKAMTDAGYTFDFEKKELRKIEQKPAWSEEDEKIALSIEHVMNCASLLNIVPEKVDKIRTWIKSLKQRMEGKV